MSKPIIPEVPRSGDIPRVRFDAAVKEYLEVLAGRRGTPPEALEDTASTADIIAKINELIDYLQS